MGNMTCDMCGKSGALRFEATLTGSVILICVDCLNDKECENEKN